MAEYRDEKETLRARVRALEAELEALGRDDREASERIAELRAERDDARDALRRSERERARLEKRVAKLEQRAKPGLPIEEPKPSPDWIPVAAGIAGLLVFGAGRALDVEWPALFVVAILLVLGGAVLRYGMMRVAERVAPSEDDAAIEAERRKIKRRQRQRVRVRTEREEVAVEARQKARRRSKRRR